MQDRELNKKVLKKQREGNWTVCSKSRSGKKITLQTEHPVTDVASAQWITLQTPLT